MNSLFEKLPKELKSTFRLPTEVRHALTYAADHLKGTNRRFFMAETVCAIGSGGQRMAEKILRWNRGTIRKGMHELQSGIYCIDNFSGRGRKSIEKHLPNLFEDISTIAEPKSQVDPTFRTTQIYIPLTAKSVYERLQDDGKYSAEEMPTIRTISTKLNLLDYTLKKVAKTEPKKKIPQTDAIFEQVHKINNEADCTEGVLRLSMDAKATVYIGPFSRGGKSRQRKKASDHDFAPEDTLSLYGIYLPALGESYFNFTNSKATADFITDCLENLWPELLERFNLHTLVLNLDNGPENSGSRTQFIKRMVEFANKNFVTVRLAYYPPYHSKYNPVERIWGILENHWRGELLTTVEKTLGLARSMKRKGQSPVVKYIEGDYQGGIKLSKKEMAPYEEQIQRMPGLEKWFIDIPPLLN